ncbi:MAG: sugar phosphate nucleotidyltransferase [bacterium]
MELNLRDQNGYSACLPDVNSFPIETDLYNQKESITKAVIIAAGNGSRLRGHQTNRPKPLVNVGGLPLLKRVILSAKKIGVTEFVIVLGYQAAHIRKSINAKKMGVKITWVRNLEWRKPNGISVLKAEKFVDGQFYLFMSDHVFAPQILEKLKDIGLAKHCGTLCVDYRLNKIQNLDDATKVRTDNGRLVDLGKSLTDFNAIDVGIFICTPELFDALRRSHDAGAYTLSDGVRILAQEGKMCTFNIGNDYWQDVDTIPDVYAAERLLLRSTRSEGDGFIAKHLNRKISNRITKWLLKTPITPNQISILNFVLSLFTAWLVSFGKPMTTIFGGIFFQLASILDGCDGEVALIKLNDSKFGAFIDTLTDHLSYFVFVIGLTLGVYQATQNESVFYITGIVLGSLLFALTFGLLYIKKKGSASLRVLNKNIDSLNHPGQNKFMRFLTSLNSFGRRDFFAFAAMVVMLFGSIQLIYWMVMVAVALMATGIAITSIYLLSKQFKFSLLSPFRKLQDWLSNWFDAPKSINLETEQEIPD